MNCPKCSQLMKEYLGLKETGWDCVNTDCGKEINITAPIPIGNDEIHFNIFRGPDLSSSQSDGDDFEQKMYDQLCEDMIKALDKSLYDMGTPDPSAVLWKDDLRSTIMETEKVFLDYATSIYDTSKSYEIGPATDERLVELAGMFGFERYMGESDDDFRFRIRALANP